MHINSKENKFEKNRPESTFRSEDFIPELQIKMLFDLEELQKTQDAFSRATGVASLMTTPDGQQITKPSNFTRLCRDIIRKTDKGQACCKKSDAALGRFCNNDLIIQPCLSAGLWDAGARIHAGDQHVATWLIGQVRNENLDEEKMIAFCNHIGANEEEFRSALAEVPVMSNERFREIAESLSVMAQHLSNLAYRNLQQAQIITERDIVQKALLQSEERLALALEASNQGAWDWYPASGKLILSSSYFTMLDYKPDEFESDLTTFERMLHPDDKEEAMIKVVAAKEGGNYINEFRLRKKAGDYAHILSYGKGVDLDSDGRPKRIVGTHIDISEQIRTKTEIARRETYESLVAEIASNFVAVRVSDTGLVIKDALRRLGETLDVCRSYVLIFEEGYSTFNQTDEWCARGVESLQSQRVSVEVMPWAFSQLLNLEHINVPDVAGLSDEACRERDRWQGQGLQALLGAPIRAAGKLIGLLGIESQKGSCHWKDVDVRLLQTIAEIFGNAIDSQTSDRLLRESEERLTLAIESTNDGIWDWNLNTNEVFFSPGYSTMLGYKPGELPESLSTFEKLLHPEDRKDVMAWVKKHAVSGERFEREFRMLTKDGENIHILSRGKGVASDSKGRPTRLLGTHVDLSERKHYEKKVLKVAEGISSATGENFFSSLVQHLGEVLDAQLVIVSQVVPDQQKKMRLLAIKGCSTKKSGYEYEIEGSPCELLGEGKVVTIPFGVREQFPCFSIVADQKVESFAGAPLVDSKGEIIGTLSAFFTSPSENMRAKESKLRIFAVRASSELERLWREEDLKQERSRYKKLYQQFLTILEGIPDKISLLSPNLKVLWSNQQGVMPDEAGSNITGSLHCYEYSEKQVPFCKDCHAAKAFSSGAIQEALLRCGPKTFRVKFFPLLDEQGEVHSVISLSSDITEKKRLQEESQRASRLASLGEVAAGVAHEINNPNALILLNTSILADILKTIFPILQDRFMQQGDFLLGKMPYSRMVNEIPKIQLEVTDAAEKIRDIVAEMRSFVTDVNLAEAAEIDLNNLVENTLKIFCKVHQKAPVDFHPGSTSLRVKGNATQLEQVFTNLFQNGVEALSGSTGKVSVSVDCSANGATAFVDVCDSGEGIPDDCFEKITDPFFTTKRDRGGTGLGLSISSRIIKEHGGTIRFFSAQEQGTRVRVELPAFVRRDK